MIGIGTATADLALHFLASVDLQVRPSHSLSSLQVKTGLVVTVVEVLPVNVVGLNVSVASPVDVDAMDVGSTVVDTRVKVSVAEQKSISVVVPSRLTFMGLHCCRRSKKR